MSSEKAQIHRADYVDGSVKYLVTDKHPKYNMFEEKDTTQMSSGGRLQMNGEDMPYNKDILNLKQIRHLLIGIWLLLG